MMVVQCSGATGQRRRHFLGGSRAEIERRGGRTRHFSVFPQYSQAARRARRAASTVPLYYLDFYVATIVPATIPTNPILSLISTSGADSCRYLYLLEMESSDELPSSSEKQQSSSSLRSDVLGSATAGIISRILTHPLDTVKARLQAPSGSFASYRGPIDALIQTYRLEGIRSLYGGFGAVIVGGK